MHIDDFSYHLPEHLIAQQPVEPRDACRLLVLPRYNGTCQHTVFSQLHQYLQPGDRLVFNNTEVIPARVYAHKSTGGKVELFFLEKIDRESWKALVSPGRRVPEGTLLILDDNPGITFRVNAAVAKGERSVMIEKAPVGETLETVMSHYGHVPLPHYINREDTVADRETYQTVYAAVPGAVAAPTAGLHFTEPLFDRLREMGVRFSTITLHVGIGTFRPVKVDDPRKHEMHEERFRLSAEAVDEIERTRAAGGRIIAVGTTVVRVLEHCFAVNGRLLPQQGTTKIMILPPYEFGVVNGLITNFHLPRSTLIMLVSAFSERERVLTAYKEAVASSYRFYSYGDAMLII
ncbi:tRNA preQ1(34) S-adenosylmethionine ribosyltransferase-isomerase QueA [bacterium]|nr:tRNA preQ1(34) S-adenosylmethionine ribosyltransferase-isomerase QueA [candidate division CSSED10-310 bacterium]